MEHRCFVDHFYYAQENYVFHSMEHIFLVIFPRLLIPLMKLYPLSQLYIWTSMVFGEEESELGKKNMGVGRRVIFLKTKGKIGNLKVRGRWSFFRCVCVCVRARWQTYLDDCIVRVTNARALVWSFTSIYSHWLSGNPKEAEEDLIDLCYWHRI